MKGKASSPDLAAQLPPPGLVGLNPEWSRLVTAPDHQGVNRTWHVLDNGVRRPRLTLLCVHGNPSWSYLWRKLLADAPDDVRVVAVDQLDMGFSERSGVLRRLADRVNDLSALTMALGLSGSVVTVAHDWGGPISLGWAQQARNAGSVQIRGIVLTNTAVHQPLGSPTPALIQAARARGILRRVTVDTTLFIRGALAMSRPGIDPAIKVAYLAPYHAAARRQAIADFVEDIPLEQGHPSWAALAAIAEGVDTLGELPSLLLWGPTDRVFSDLYLHDLESRLPQAQVHRFPGASHFVSEDADVSGTILRWLASADFLAPQGERPPPVARQHRRTLWAELERAASEPSFANRDAVVEQRGGAMQRVSFGELARRVNATAGGLASVGVCPGDRVALMIPPGVDLSVALYSCWRLGAVAVLIDSGLGARNMSRAFASANPAYLVGIAKALAAARVLRWPGQRVLAGDANPATRRGLGIEHTLAEVETLGATSAEPTLPAEPSEEDLAAIVFTSGATGPSKGVAYRHHQIQAQRDVLTELYRITPADRLVAAFAPFALYGPALGITSIVPRMDVTRPATLTAVALADAARAVGATLVFASPAALANVVATADALQARQRGALADVRLLLSAGAPVNPALLAQAAALMPAAEAHTPYGMTEVLPVADVSLDQLRSLDPATAANRGVCVGGPAPNVRVRISAIDNLGHAGGPPTDAPNVVGEILVSAPHAKDHYDRLYNTEILSGTPAGWHRSGDIGSIDEAGRLWVGGRMQHVITTAAGPVLPVPLELATESVDGVQRACAVGIGPTGAQVAAIVVEDGQGARRGHRTSRPHLADLWLSDAVRTVCASATAVTPAMVLVVPELPVDGRHNSKIDRSRVARWVSDIASGGRIGSL